MRLRKFFAGILAFAAMGFLILDSENALAGAETGIEICLKSVIPVFFPFFFLSPYLIAGLSDYHPILLRPVFRAMGIPAGAEPVFLASLIGGYPVGAMGVADGYRDGRLTAAEADRMLGFCVNAGPAFIFGILGNLFEKSYIVWILWGIHIISAVLTACLLPGKSRRICRNIRKPVPNPSKVLSQSCRSLAAVCGWIILFQVLIRFLNVYLLKSLSVPAAGILRGILEITSGILSLNNVDNQSLRFMICAVLTAFGGLCVYLQVTSVTESLRHSRMIPGKLIQTGISFLLAWIISFVLFDGIPISPASVLILLIVSSGIFLIIVMLKKQNTGGNLKLSAV